MKANRIRELLGERKKTQKALADYIGVSENGLKKMFDTDRYKVDTLVKIAEFLEVDSSEILNETKVGPGLVKSDHVEDVSDLAKMNVELQLLRIRVGYLEEINAEQKERIIEQKERIAEHKAYKSLVDAIKQHK